MAQVYRERDIRYTRERSPGSSDDERQYKTVSTYKVGGPSGTTTRLERVERYEEEDDRRSRYSHVGRPSPEVIEVDRRTEKLVYPDRPRSALEPPSRGSDSLRGDGDRLRTVEYEREVERDRDYYIPERRSRTRVVEETRDVISPSRDHYWERRRPWDDHETDLRLEKRVVRRDSDGDVKVKEKSLDIYKDKHHHHDEPREYKDRDIRIERRYVEDRDPHDAAEVERYRREVEYYSAPDPPQAPIVMRQKMPEQKVIINEAPHPAPVIIPRADPAFIVLREGNREPRRDEDYYRRHDERRDSYDEDYYIKKTVIRRDRSSSSDHHKKRHLAEGALAGAGLGALVGSRRSKDGEHEHKGRKVLAGAALGALGTEVIRRARSAYEDRHDEYDEEYDDRHRYHSRSKSRSRLATGLAIGAAALAVAGGLKYMQRAEIAAAGLTGAAAAKLWERHKDKKNRENRLVRVPDVEYGSEPLEPYDSPSEEPRRGHRSKHRHRSSSSSDREVAKKRSRSTLREVAAAGLGTAAAAIGIKKYSDHRKSKERGYEEAVATNPDYADYHDAVPSSSPPNASGGFPPTNQAAPSATLWTQ
ncbi:hypothetical protein ONZ43_g2149 [Nemania bipapillata]|uniref:Uncharacterized protein n=1 Tax=Nemania bipapillata TaxID=110536 RepID=A0ACC2J1Q8_9PEZI|nr:hypothetical protein ONZ43_g2149 [Nemania bipapillata]